jgi:glycosyltransferase involved in cell wall biosynthesis
MPNSNAKVAILLATYNGGEYIQEFLESLCLQSHSDFCLYIRDDGSLDSTCQIAAGYTDRLEIRFLGAGERMGPAASFFRIMEQAHDSHDCYLFADQDDWWYEDKVERAVAALDSRQEEIALYCSRLEYVDDQLKHIGYSRIPKLLTVRNAAVENVATGCTVAVTRKTRREVLSANPRGFIMHDWWLYLFCASMGQVIYDPSPSIKYRQHGGNAIGAATNVLEDFRRRWRRFAKRDGGVHLLSHQAQAFLACYGERLPTQHKELLEGLISGKRSLWRRLLLAAWPPVARQSPGDTLVMRVLFLLGRY